MQILRKLKFSFSFKNKILVTLAVISLFVIYFIPDSAEFQGKIKTYKIQWEAPGKKKQQQQLMIEEMSVASLRVESIEGESLHIAARQTREPIEFLANGQEYSFQDLEVQGLEKLVLQFFPSQEQLEKLPLLVVNIRAKSVSFVIVNDLLAEQVNPLTYKQGSRVINTQNQNLSIQSTAIRLHAYLPNDGRGDIFSSDFRNQAVSPNSMQFQTSRSKHDLSTILEGELTVKEQPETIKLSRGYFVQFLPQNQGITQLKTITLFPETNPAAFLVDVSGKMSRIEIGSNPEQPIKTYDFHRGRKVLKNFFTTVVFSGILIALFQDLVKDWLKKMWIIFKEESNKNHE